ncbi:hypothetical protein [Nocardia tengchongensis]
MRRNRYRDTCVDCKGPVGENKGFLFGNSNAVVCEDCVYWSYGVAHGYFREGPRPVRSVLLRQDDQQ